MNDAKGGRRSTRLAGNRGLEERVGDERMQSGADRLFISTR